MSNTFKDKVIKEIGYAMDIPNEKDIVFASLFISRRENGTLNTTFMHLEDEDITDELRLRIANALRSLAESIEPHPNRIVIGNDADQDN